MAKTGIDGDLYDLCPICEGTGYQPEQSEGELKPCIVCGGEKYTRYGLNGAQVRAFSRQRDEAQKRVAELEAQNAGGFAEFTTVLDKLQVATRQRDSLKALLKRWMTYEEMEEVVETEGFIQLYNDSCAILEYDAGALLIESEGKPDVLSPEVREAFEESWKNHEAGYRYLADEGKRKGDESDE